MELQIHHNILSLYLVPSCCTHQLHTVHMMPQYVSPVKMSKEICVACMQLKTSCYVNRYFIAFLSMISGFMSGQMCAFSGYGWRDGLQMWRVAVNICILNKQSRTADSGWSASWEVGRGANKSPPYKLTLLRNISQGFRLGLVLWNEGLIWLRTGTVVGSCECGGNELFRCP